MFTISLCFPPENKRRWSLIVCQSFNNNLPRGACRRHPFGLLPPCRRPISKEYDEQPFARACRASACLLSRILNVVGGLLLLRLLADDRV